MSLMEYQFDVALILTLFTVYLSYLINILVILLYDLVESESEQVVGLYIQYPTIYFSLFYMAD